MKRPRGQPTPVVLPATRTCQTKTELGERRELTSFRGNGLATAADGVKARPMVCGRKVHACVRASCARVQQLTDVRHLPQEPEQASPYPAEAVDSNSDFWGRHSAYSTAVMGLTLRSCGLWDEQVGEMPATTG